MPVPTIKPTYISIFPDSEAFPDLPEGTTKQEMGVLFNLPGSTDTAVFWNGHEFEISTFRFAWGDRPGFQVGMEEDADSSPLEGLMHVYYPIDPRTTRIDWAGATSATPNETNSGWLPAHCDADYHNDHELRLEAAIIGLFQPEIDALSIDAMTKGATLAKRPGDSSASSRELAARLKLQNLITVRGHLLVCALREIRGKYIGWYHQNPDKSHLHEEIHDCLGKAILLNGVTQSAVYQSVSAEVGRIHSRLNTKHKYETRWDKAARLTAEAEAKKKAEG